MSTQSKEGSMHTTRMRHHLTALVAALITLSLVGMPVLANHSWGSYHWQRSTAGTVSLKVGDNVSGHWETMLTEAVDDWNNPTNAYNDYQAQYNTWTGPSKWQLRDGPAQQWGEPSAVSLTIQPGTAGTNC